MSLPGSYDYLQIQLERNIAAGQKLVASEFELTFDDYPKLAVLVRSASIPAIGREIAEEFGPMGMKIQQPTVLKNAGEMTINIVETTTGEVLKSIIDHVLNKKLTSVTMRATPESTMGLSADSLTYQLKYCSLESDAVEFSTEDVTNLIKVPITLRYNWIGFLRQ